MRGGRAFFVPRAASCWRASVGQGQGLAPLPGQWTERRAFGDRGGAAVQRRGSAARALACVRVCGRVRLVAAAVVACPCPRALVGLARACVPSCVRVRAPSCALARVRAGVRRRAGVRPRACVRVWRLASRGSRLAAAQVIAAAGQGTPPVARPRAPLGDRRGKSKKGERRGRK